MKQHPICEPRSRRFFALSRAVAFSASVASLALASAQALASDQIGTLTQVDGDVKLFSHPSKKLQEGAPGTHALYEGEYFVVEPAKAGDKVDQSNIVRTAPGAKARVVFDNGDQLNVGPATAMRVHWDKDAKNTTTRMDLAYGKVRGIVEKGGPRSHLQIRTRTATMGVRGTDFFIADGGTDGGTEVSILRGAVEVKPKAAGAKAVEVKQGMSADVPPSTPVASHAIKRGEGGKPEPVQPAVELRQTTQQELAGIQRSSTIEKKPDAPATAPAQAAALAKLEQKAVTTTLKDIKTYDPKLYEQLQAKAPKSTDEINRQVVATLAKEAPKAPEAHKPHKSEIDDLEQGAYEKYFKVE
jgi:hypothetical protein